jgi:hypothetical protein
MEQFDKPLRELICDYLEVLDANEYPNIKGMMEEDTELQKLVSVIEAKVLNSPDMELKDIINQIEISTYNF